MSLEFDLATPDPGPGFEMFMIREEIQLPGRPMGGKIEIARFFQHLQLFVVEGRRRGVYQVFQELRTRHAPVLGSNVGQFLHENQACIPVKLRDNVMVFPGTIYTDSGFPYALVLKDDCYVLSLGWNGRARAWECSYLRIGVDLWRESYRAVILSAR